MQGFQQNFGAIKGYQLYNLKLATFVYLIFVNVYVMLFNAVSLGL